MRSPGSSGWVAALLISAAALPGAGGLAARGGLAAPSDDPVSGLVERLDVEHVKATLKGLT